MHLQQTADLGDIVRLARRRIPRFAFDFLDSGAGEDGCVRRNAGAFENVLLRPRYLRGVSAARARTETELFGRSYALPFGLAPTGMNHLIWPGSDLMLARLAAAANIPLVNSTQASRSIEDVAAAAPDVTWFQLYPRVDDAVNADMLRRAWDAGVRVLVVTVDLPGAPNRNRDFRNGFGGVPFRFGRNLALDALTHPRWLLGWLRHGSFSFANLAPYIGSGTGNATLMKMARSTKFDFSWSDLQQLRRLWRGQLVVKGILDGEDAALAVREGVDGVWVSNHGGRQLESAPAALHCLPQVVDAVQGRARVLFDSGVRSGEDVVKALALGADFVFLGRSLLYGAAAGGAPGAARVLELYRKDLVRTMTQIGCPAATLLDRDALWAPAGRTAAAAGAAPGGDRPFNMMAGQAAIQTLP
ncbi:alpha-hydroxy acid oxidase [Massilia putida]|uniref:alpha-hydroxy acid oxidase n=1 Tax=Massilia putida TaxID=1141883 RepID=UPI0009533FA1|nr:alpha-hydroxy acid oxidase [Massilia putida]